MKLRFRIFKNSKNDPAIEKKKAPKPQGLFEELYPDIKHWVGEEAFRKIIADFPESQVKFAVQATLNRLRNGENIANVTGYIIALSKQTNLFDPIQDKKEKAATKKAAREQSEIRKLELEAQKRKLFNELKKKEDAIIEALFLEMPDLQEELLEQVKKNRFSGYQKDSFVLKGL